MPATKPKNGGQEIANQPPATLADVRDAIFWNDELIDFHSLQQTSILTNILQALQQQNTLLTNILEAQKQPVLSVPVSQGQQGQPSTVVLEAADWLRANPEHMSKSVRQIAALSSYSKSTIDRAKRLLDKPE